MKLRVQIERTTHELGYIEIDVPGYDPKASVRSNRRRINNAARKALPHTPVAWDKDCWTTVYPTGSWDVPDKA